MLYINDQITIPSSEIEIEAIRAQGAGGQNVNKVSSAVRLRFDIASSSLPELYKGRLLELEDQRITGDGVIVLKAQTHRSQLKNREEALRRLQELVRSVTVTQKKRKATQPSFGSEQKRLERKRRRGEIKSLRRSSPELD